jgi:hypothetical protein
MVSSAMGTTPRKCPDAGNKRGDVEAGQGEILAALDFALW